MVSPEMIAAIVGAATAFGSRELIVGLIGWISGRQAREQLRVRELVAERDRSEEERDTEAAYRRILQEHSSLCRRIMLDAGIPAERIPPFPHRPAR